MQQILLRFCVNQSSFPVWFGKRETVNIERSNQPMCVDSWCFPCIHLWESAFELPLDEHLAGGEQPGACHIAQPQACCQKSRRYQGVWCQPALQAAAIPGFGVFDCCLWSGVTTRCGLVRVSEFEIECDLPSWEWTNCKQNWIGHLASHLL